MKVQTGICTKPTLGTITTKEQRINNPQYTVEFIHPKTICVPQYPTHTPPINTWDYISHMEQMRTGWFASKPIFLASATTESCCNYRGLSLEMASGPADFLPTRGYDVLVPSKANYPILAFHLGTMLEGVTGSNSELVLLDV